MLMNPPSESESAALVRAKLAAHTSVFSASPGMPVELWAALAVTAGVHMFVDNSKCTSWEVGDVIDVRGRFLMLHASSSCAPGRTSRTLMLPFPATVRNEANVAVCHGCTSFTTDPMDPGDVQLFTLW
jgi:hypothetical protein